MSKFITFRDNTKRKYIINADIIKAISHMDGNDYIKIFYKFGCSIIHRLLV